MSLEKPLFELIEDIDDWNESQKDLFQKYDFIDFKEKVNWETLQDKLVTGFEDYGRVCIAYFAEGLKCGWTDKCLRALHDGHVSYLKSTVEERGAIQLSDHEGVLYYAYENTVESLTVPLKEVPLYMDKRGLLGYYREGLGLAELRLQHGI